MKKSLKHTLKFLIALTAFMSSSITYAANGTYSDRTINGAVSTWDFGAATTGAEKKITSGTIDNDIYFVNSNTSNQKLASSGGLSNKATSELYIPVVSANSAGNIAMTSYGTSDGRWLQLYVGANAAADTKRLWSKSNATADGKKGPQNFDFTSSDLTQVNGVYYLKLVSNNTEMKIATMTVTLSNGDTYGSGGGGGSTTTSSDATLSDIKVDGHSIAGFSANSTNYNVTIPATQATAPVVSATKNDSKAGDPVITQAQLPNPGQSTQATIVVTAEDGTTKTYTITFTRAELSHDADLKDIKVNGQSIAGFAAGTTTYNVQIPYSSTTQATIAATTNNTAANAVVTGYTTVEGTATITVTAEDGTTTKTYTVNITKAAASSDANLKELKYNGTSVPNFSAATLTYSVELPFGTTAVANVTATANYSAANVQITQSQTIAGTATVVVTAEDGTQKTYTITFTVADEPVTPVPPTTLTLHTPGTYEEKTLAGGYETPLTVVNGREYEVYYATYDASSRYQVATTPARKIDGITTTTTDNYSCKAKDEWMQMHATTSKSDFDMPAQAEFASGQTAVHKLLNNGYYELHIKGFDQFSFFGKDNSITIDPSPTSTKNKRFQVYIDDILQPETQVANSATIRRYDITTGEHVIKVVGIGASNNEFYGFSLRIAQEPRLKKIKGNDSTQVILQTLAPKPVVYFTKYNSMGRTELVWDGPAATGITLTTGNTNALGDTLILGGTAQCPVGTYHFHVAAYNNQNKETSRESGSFSVISKITAQTDTIIDAYTGESMDEIKFKYYALSGNDVTIEWQPAAPAGITTSVNNGIYTITGTPTQTGTYTYTITVAGGNSIPGQITIKTLDLGNDPILYLYKNNLGYEKDGIYKYLTESKHLNLVARKAKSELRPAEQYTPYKLIIISEDVDATNPEVLAIARGEGQQKPVLNMKSFTYSPSRLDWGEPDNGSLINREITVVRGDHPIFQTLNKHAGDKIVVLDTITTKGLMPAVVDYEGTLCLATALTRGREYLSDGQAETFLHEVPDSLRGGAKYICLPISIYSSNNLSTDGKRLIDATISYLRGTASSVALPELEIKAATLAGKAAVVDQTNNEIKLTVKPSDNIDLEHVTCTFSLKDATTHAIYEDYSGEKHIINLSGEVIDLSDTRNGVDVIVTDYINVRHYTVIIDMNTAIDEVYTAGEWVKIYDIQGRLISTTNEDIRSMELPRGLYLIQTSNGILKVMK